MERETTHLRCHPVTLVHDGCIVTIRTLVQTQIVSEAVLQLGITRKARRNEKEMMGVKVFKAAYFSYAALKNQNQNAIKLFY